MSNLGFGLIIGGFILAFLSLAGRRGGYARPQYTPPPVPEMFKPVKDKSND